MNLNHWLKKVNVGQRELGRRLNYSSNGYVQLVAKGNRYVPPDDILAWADALGLEGADREAFISECVEESIPKWYRDKLAALELQVAELHAQVDQALLKAKKSRAK